MSDTAAFAGDAGLDFSDAIAEAAPAAAPEQPAGDVNWEERYRSEVQDRIREREQYKPYKQIFGQMHPDDAQAVQQFAQAWAAGDQESAIRWMVDNARTLAGDNFQQYISPQQQAAAQASVDINAIDQGQAAGITPEQIQQLVATELQNYQQEQAIQQYQVEIDQTLRELGLEPETPLAHAAIIAATNRPDLDLRAAVTEMENQILQQAQGIVEKRRAGGAAMPSASPNGMAANIPPSSTPRDRAMARLEQQGM